MQWYRNLENKLESLNLILKNKKVKLNSVVSFCLPLYTLTILFSLFLLTKQKDDFLEQHFILNDNSNDCVSMVTVSEHGIIQFSSMEEEKSELGDLFPFLSCRDNGPRDYRNYLQNDKEERLTF